MKEYEAPSTALFLYGITPVSTNVVKYTVKFMDDVDGDVLRRAVDKSFERFPYMKVSVVKTDKGFIFRENDNPISVEHGSKSPVLNSEETNRQQIAIRWDGQYLYFYNTHALMDGRGRWMLLKALLYNYCSERYSEQITMPDIDFLNEPVDPAENMDPYDSPIEPDFSFQLPQAAPQKALNIYKAGIAHQDGRYRRIIFKMNESKFMELCKSSDSTPNTGIAALFCRAVRKLHPDSELPPVGNVCVDLRAAIGKPKTHFSTITSVGLRFDRRMEGMSFSEQNTIFRGQLLLHTDPAVLRTTASGMQKLMSSVRDLPTFEDKLKSIEELSTVLGLGDSSTFTISYSGKSDYGDCNKHIRGFLSEPFVSTIPVLLEITAANGSFFISWIQCFPEDDYRREFCNQLEEVGAQYEIIADDILDIPGMEL